MTIVRAANSSIKRGRADWFTGTVWLDELDGAAPSPIVSGLRALRVTFEPAARTAWHTHPHGQVLHILSGVARIGRADGRVAEALPGDSVWFDAGERHWHGAAPGCLMTHLAVQRTDATGESATWFEHVTDAEYLRSVG